MQRIGGIFLVGLMSQMRRFVLVCRIGFRDIMKLMYPRG